MAKKKKDYTKSDLLKLSDRQLGAMCRQFIVKIDDWANKEWSEKADLVVGLSFMCSSQLIKMAHDSNAGELNIDYSDVTLNNGPAGDWRLELRQTRAPTKTEIAKAAAA